MEFLNPLALVALGALPLLLVPYLIRRKPRRHFFSSLLLLEAFAIRPERRFWGRLRLPLLFLLQLIILALLVAASGEPVWREAAGGHFALVLDNSASMQAMEDGLSRFDRAKHEAVRALRSLPAGSRIDVYLTVPWAGIVGRDLSVREASALIENSRAYDLADTPNRYEGWFHDLMQEQEYRRLLLFTDRPVRGTSEKIESFSLGRPRNNVAITGFDVDRGGLGSAGPSARVEVSNFSTKAQEIEAALLGDGKRIGTAERRVRAGQNAVFEFDGFPAAAYYEARVETEPADEDALAVDNRRYAVALAGTATPILAVSPRSEAVESLRKIPGLQIEVIQPEAYGGVTEQRYGLEIFHLAAPRALPRNNALFILPPEENPMVFLGAPEAGASVSGWSDTHPLTRYVNLSMLRPPYSRPLEARVPAHSILEGPSGSLAMTFERDGFRYAVLGFDPLPFLGAENLPMSVLTLNVLGWLGDGMTSVNQSTGEPLSLAREVLHETLTPAAPNGMVTEGRASQEPPVLFQGVYERFRNGRRELVAVNFDGPAESDLLNPAPVIVNATATRVGAASGTWPLWPYVVVMCLVLLTLEWFLNPPKLEGR